MEAKKQAIIFDVDGTLAENMDGRIARHGKKAAPFQEWDAWDDKPSEHVIKMLNSLKEEFTIIICSGRKDSAKDVLKDWLAEHDVHYDELFMRKSNDNRGDYTIKSEIYFENIEPFYEVFAAFDDRDQVVKAWRDLGIKTFQVAEGNF